MTTLGSKTFLRIAGAFSVSGLSAYLIATRMSLPKMYGIVSLANLANALLPFRAGELSHVWLVYRCASVSIGANLASLVVVRLGRGVLPLTAHTVYTWIAIYLTFYLLARATALEVTFAEIVFVGSLPVIASALPLPTIAGWARTR